MMEIPFNARTSLDRKRRDLYENKKKTNIICRFVKMKRLRIGEDD